MGWMFGGNGPLFQRFGGSITSADFHSFRKYLSLSTKLMMSVRATTVSLGSARTPHWIFCHNLGFPPFGSIYQTSHFLRVGGYGFWEVLLSLYFFYLFFGQLFRDRPSVL